jgi:TatD DNase family protein
MVSWIDSHNHLQFLPPGEVPEVLAALAAAGVVRGVVNATSEQDWDAVAALAAAWPGRLVPAFGIHPWRAHELAAGWPGRLREMLEKHPLAGVGECGLDRRHAGAALALQRGVFEEQLRLARELCRTVSIHCVKAWGELLAALLAAGPGKYLLHSYGGSLELARRLIPLGAWFSFSPNLGGPGRERALEVFRQLPRNRLLVESDAPQRAGQSAAAGRHPADLPATGKLLADALGLTVAEVAELTRHNAGECCGWPPAGG